MTSTTTEPTATEPSTTAAEPENVGEVAIRVEELIAVLTAVRPFADPESTYLACRQVRLAAGNGMLTATATDRYTVGHARRPIVAGRFAGQVLLPAERVDQLLPWLRDGVEEYETVRLSATAESLTVTAVDTSVTVAQGTCGGGDFALIGQLVDPAAYEQANGTTGLALTLNPSYLARVHAAVAHLGYTSCGVNVFFRGVDKAVRVEAGDWFVALLMPIAVKAGEDDTALVRPVVPFALPDQQWPHTPVTDQPTDVSLPLDESEATVGRMVRHSCAEVMRLQAKLTVPRSTPPGGDRTPESRAEFEVYRDRVAALLGAFGVAHLLRELHALAPAAAAKASRELWGIWTDGGGPGEWAYEWLTDYGVDARQLVDTFHAQAEAR